MKFKKSWWILIFFNAAYLLTFLIYYLSIKNFEFVWYILITVGIFLLIVFTIQKSKFDDFILWGLTLWGLLHMLGGGLIVNGETLYKFIIPIVQSGDFVILRFDQIVHFIGFGVGTFVGFHLIKPYLGKNTNWKVVYPLIVLIGMGLGVVNEIVEFIAVVTFPQTGVGGYYNTGLDLIFNTLGSIGAVFIIHYRRKHVKENQKRE